MVTSSTKRAGNFSVTDSTKVCSLHFKVENLKKSLGIGRLTLVERAVPSAFGCAIVRRGDWLGKPANFRGACLC